MKSLVVTALETKDNSERKQAMQQLEEQCDCWYLTPWGAVAGALESGIWTLQLVSSGCWVELQPVKVGFSVAPMSRGENEAAIELLAKVLDYIKSLAHTNSSLEEALNSAWEQGLDKHLALGMLI